jgi:hypothetical protein
MESPADALSKGIEQTSYVRWEEPGGRQQPARERRIVSGGPERGRYASSDSPLELGVVSEVSRTA